MNATSSNVEYWCSFAHIFYIYVCRKFNKVSAMQLFYHPTSVAIIDDDQNFLESFSFYLSDDFLCQTFRFPEEALLHLMTQEKERQLSHFFFSDPRNNRDYNQLSVRDGFIRWEASTVEEILKTTKRFERISVAVIDFEMPGMNGLELCRQIADLPIRKILLTGKMGSETAIRAFNDGLIDCFLMKQDNNLTERLHREIMRLQKKYFSQLSNSIQPVKRLNELLFLEEPGFHTLFSNILNNRDIDEYYLSTYPSGMLLVHKDGDVCFLNVTTEVCMEQRLNVAKKLNAPDQLISLLDTKQITTLFPTANGLYSPELEQSWSQYIWPAQKFSGSKTQLFFSLVEDEVLPAQMRREVVSYNDYVDEME